MLPLCERMYPVTRLTSVVLPAPLGPIKPKMVPCSISRDTSSTAWTPPNDRLTLVSCSSALTGSPARPPARRDDGEAAPADDALRPEDDDQDQDDAVDDVAIGGKLAHNLRQRGEEDGSHDWADHVRRPADHGEGEDLDGAGSGRAAAPRRGRWWRPRGRPRAVAGPVGRRGSRSRRPGAHQPGC